MQNTHTNHNNQRQVVLERVFMRPPEFVLISPLLRRWTIDWPNFVPKHCTKTTTKINSIWTTGPTNWSCFLHLLMILYALRIRNTCEVTIHATAVSTSVVNSAFFPSNLAFSKFLCGTMFKNIFIYLCRYCIDVKNAKLDGKIANWQHLIWAILLGLLTTLRCQHNLVETAAYTAKKNVINSSL